MDAISASLDNRVVSYTTVNIMMNAISASLDNKVVYYTSEYYDECHLCISFKNFRPLDNKVVYCIVNIITGVN